MLKKLKFAKNAAGFCAALCGILALLAANGTHKQRSGFCIGFDDSYTGFCSIAVG